LKDRGCAWPCHFKDAGHTDGRVTRQTLAGALEWLSAGDPELSAARMPED
jgi:hypothetical protein